MQIKDQLLRTPIAGWVGTIRRESTREENAEVTIENEGAYRSGDGGGEGPLRDPGPELLLREGARK